MIGVMIIATENSSCSVLNLHVSSLGTLYVLTMFLLPAS
jgi:hypothetical protein